jgi:hypothetical protein
MSSQVIQTIWGISFFVCIPIVIVYLYEAKSIVDKLNHDHVDTYKALGEFSLLANNSPANSAKFTTFLLKKAYLALDDPQITNKGNRCKLLLISGTKIMGVSFLSPLIFMLIRMTY